MAIMRKLTHMARKQKEVHPLPATWHPRYARLSSHVDSQNHDVRKGFVPVMVGPPDGAGERVFVPTRFISHPVVVSMLESGSDEFGFGQGVIQVPVEPEYFREIIRSLE